MSKHKQEFRVGFVVTYMHRHSRTTITESNLSTVLKHQKGMYPWPIAPDWQLGDTPSGERHE